MSFSGRIEGEDIRRSSWRLGLSVDGSNRVVRIK